MATAFVTRCIGSRSTGLKQYGIKQYRLKQRDLTEANMLRRVTRNRFTEMLWRDRRLGAGAAIGVAALAGVVVGVALRTRWAMLLAPVVFAATFEVARIRSDGPTIDGIHPRSTYGILSLVVGRGFHGLEV